MACSESPVFYTSEVVKGCVTLFLFIVGQKPLALVLDALLLRTRCYLYKHDTDNKRDVKSCLAASAKRSLNISCASAQPDQNFYFCIYNLNL